MTDLPFQDPRVPRRRPSHGHGRAYASEPASRGPAVAVNDAGGAARGAGSDEAPAQKQFRESGRLAQGSGLYRPGQK